MYRCVCLCVHNDVHLLYNTHTHTYWKAPTFSRENLQPWKQIYHQTHRQRCEKLTEQNIDRPCLSWPSHRLQSLSVFDLKWSLRHHNGIQDSTNTSTVQKAFDKTAEEQPGCLDSESPSRFACWNLSAHQRKTYQSDLFPDIWCILKCLSETHHCRFETLFPGCIKSSVCGQQADRKIVPGLNWALLWIKILNVDAFFNPLHTHTHTRSGSCSAWSHMWKPD